MDDPGGAVVANPPVPAADRGGGPALPWLMFCFLGALVGHLLNPKSPSGLGVCLAVSILWPPFVMLRERGSKQPKRYPADSQLTEMSNRFARRCGKPEMTVHVDGYGEGS